MDLYAVFEEAEKQNEDYLAILIDSEKAFDTLSWEFLIKLLRQFGLPEEFITWVKIIYAIKELRFINYGHLSPPIYPTRGVVQGCGLSNAIYPCYGSTCVCGAG